ncbi:hypothetical protein CHS0354_031969 [Potamilus streckersoni]|uniref:Uncharacterized protein n=1 Tax=Potamilus streckersoni TaxID=2493646 RepID=A0AAE0WFE4_9BIVA|nr:hypothetical protein CHS0354_031969 [Potamilus streckersoni]
MPSNEPNKCLLSFMQKPRLLIVIEIIEDKTKTATDKGNSHSLVHKHFKKVYPCYRSILEFMIGPVSKRLVTISNGSEPICFPYMLLNEKYAFTIHGVVGNGVYVTSQQQTDATREMEYKCMLEKPHLKFNTAYIRCLRSLFTHFSTSEMKPGLEGCILTQSGLEKVTPQKYFQKPEKYKTNSTVEVVQGNFTNMPHIPRVRPDKQPKDNVLHIIVRKLEPGQHESYVSINKNHKSSPDQMQRLDGKEQKKTEKSLDDKETISAQKARAISPRAPPPTAVCKRKHRSCARHESTDLARIAQEYSKSVSYFRMTKSHQNCGPQKISRDLDILALYKKIKQRISLI